MTEYKDIIRRLRMGMGPREIQRDTAIHRTIIRGIRGIAEVEGWLDPGSPVPSEEEIQKVREGARAKKDSHHPLYAYLEEFRGWVKEGYTYVVMHQLIRERFACSEPTVRRFVQKYLAPQPKPVMVRPTVPGRDMEVDFGYLGITYDGQTRRNRKTYLFSGRLRHSRLAYREPGFQQKAQAFFLGHIHAYEYFGGVAEKAIPDYVPRNIIRVMCLSSLCGPFANRRGFLGWRPRSWQHNNHKEFNQVSRVASSLHIGLRGNSAETGGSQARRAASFARVLISA
jgi:hypothetical protein